MSSSGNRSFIRLAQFNVENLLARYRFEQGMAPRPESGHLYNEMAFSLYNEDDKRITAQVIQEIDADLLCLEEVESLNILDHFNAKYLKDAGFPFRVGIEGNDTRMIDVQVMSRLPIQALRTHRHERSALEPRPLFSRDCLEVDIDVGGKTFTLYVNHFKSMAGGRAQTHAQRAEQAQRVAQIIDERWKPSGYQGNFAFVGDANDYAGEGTALGALLNHPALVNVVDQLPLKDRWTHYYSRGNEYHQLDYILLSEALALRAGHPQPFIMRKGLPRRATRYTGPWFPGVGQDRPKASDHAPVVIDLPKNAFV